MLSTIVAIVLAVISPAHADEQNTAAQTDTAPIENPPLPRPKPPLLAATDDNPAVLISEFRHQHGEDSVAALTRVAQEQANARQCATCSITMHSRRFQVGLAAVV